ncbi:hypothetical protein [Mucilaginibacter sp. FT3.2]|uniref:hypothetical protein n=1 Tax=Mucilaginibacter sp. FT3.2 TaxID=2723090 RepID=UPI001622C42F|nr:hypothetical protein [Mucilaginibacter sp. FT3.2]MBB6232685.1 hypothetical protein [Mucilaginibacter sp. FT3.2]
MKTTKTWLIALSFIIVSTTHVFGQQTKGDIFSGSAKITWLGIDFTQTRFIGTASAKVFGIGKRENNGEVTADEFRDQYTLGWNRLFIDEQKKYDVAEMVHHSAVDYAIDVAKSSNSKGKFDKLYSDNPGDFKLLDEAKIAAVVKGYDFLGHDGIGVIFFVGGMNKGMDKAGVWVTFVDMKTKTVLITKYYEGKPGGFGLKNYWAKAFLNVMKDVKSDYNGWK